MLRVAPFLPIKLRHALTHFVPLALRSLIERLAFATSAYCYCPYYMVQGELGHPVNEPARLMGRILTILAIGLAICHAICQDHVLS